MIFSARMFGVEGGSRPWRWAGALALVAATLAGCAQPPSPQARRHSNEYFSQAKYGPASPRVVEDGEPVPRGGGQYLVGHPYTIAGRTYFPHEIAHYSAVGMASWYGDAFHGRRTANGEVYDMRSFTAAHPTLPLPSYARVTNLANGYSIIVRVNDRGPYHGGRVMDVSSRVADALDFKNSGTAKIKVDYIGPAPLEGSDDSVLLASLRTNGAPATIDGLPSGAPAMVASAAPASLLPSFVRPAAPPPPAADPAPERALAVAAPNPKLLKAPPPPPRPFDLGAIARAIGPVAAAPAVPPRRPVRQAMAGDRALYFAQSDGAAARLLRHDPFAGLIEQGDAPGSRGPLANDR
ncbi:MAG: septal ring lytic transglycosylase RlpA family protein [Roseiarcus sp.]